MRIDEFVPCEEWGDGLLQKTQQVQLHHDIEADTQSDGERRERPDDAPAQLLEMIEKGHLARRIVRQRLRRPVTGLF